MQRRILDLLVRFGLPLLATFSIFYAVNFVLQGGVALSVDAPPRQPASSPYEVTVAGSGVVEPKSENIQVAAPVADIAEKIFVQVGDQVQAGDPLFVLDSRLEKAQLASREAELAAAEAELTRIRSLPRPESIPVLEAQVREAEATLKTTKDQLTRIGPLYETGAVTEQEYVAQQGSVATAQAVLERAEANLALEKAGAWKYDIDKAAAQVAQTAAAVAQAKTSVELRTVKAPIDATILQIEIRPGEFVGTPPQSPAMTIGDISTLHIRVDIDEQDIPRFRRGIPGRATPRGAANVSYPLTFVRVEPLVIPKQSLSGRNTERVDTRVLQVIYAVDQEAAELYPGQQVDVYLEVSEDSPPNSQSAT